jgi:hypothetical protein
VCTDTFDGTTSVAVAYERNVRANTRLQDAGIFQFRIALRAVFKRKSQP